MLGGLRLDRPAKIPDERKSPGSKAAEIPNDLKPDERRGRKLTKAETKEGKGENSFQGE